MLRFFLAGLLTVGALVLLFIGSFGDPMGTLQDLGASLSITTPAARQAPPTLRQADQQVPIAQPAPAPAPAPQPAPAPAPQMQASAPAPPPLTAQPAAPPQPAQAPSASAQSEQPPTADAARERDALAQQLNQMREQLTVATQQVSALRAQADQEQQDLQRLQQQRASAQQNSDQVKQGDAVAAAARAERADQLAKQVADQQATLQQLQAQSQQASAAGKQQQAALQQEIAAQQTQLDRLKTDTAQAEAAHQRQMAAANNQPPAQPAQSKDEAVAQGRGQSREPAPPAVQSPPQKIAATPAPKPTSAAKPSAPDDREQVIQRLRREANNKPSTAPQPPRATQLPNEATVQPAAPPPQPAGQPAGPPPQERLLEARNAAAAGRLDEARHLLQQAQVQLVLRPVSPWQNAPAGGSVAAGQVAEALSMLDAGDLPHAIQYINLAVAQAGWPREITASSVSPPGQGAYYPR